MVVLLVATGVSTRAQGFSPFAGEITTPPSHTAKRERAAGVEIHDRNPSPHCQVMFTYMRIDSRGAAI
jgi:hypothetical protein